MSSSRGTTLVHIVTLASGSGSYGGPFSTALEQSRIRHSAGYPVRLVCGELADDAVEPHELVFTYKVSSVLPRFRFATMFSIGMLRGLLREIRQSGLVHVAFGREVIPIVSAVLAKLFGRPLILQTHGMLTVFSRRRSIRLFDLIFVGWMVRSADAVIALTEVERRSLVNSYNLESNRVATIGNGIDLASPPFSEAVMARSVSARREVLFLARLHPRKRVGDFIAAAQMADGLGARWVIVGPDGGDGPLASHASKSGVVDWEGAVAPDQVVRRVSQCDIFVLPSLGEPWGNVLATALSLGIPVVVTRSADLAAIIRDAGGGLVCDDGAPEQIFDSVKLMLDNPHLYAAMSSAALGLAREHFGSDVLGTRLLQLTQAVLRN